MARVLMLVDIERLERVVIESGLTANRAFAIFACLERQSELHQVSSERLQQEHEVRG